MVLLGVTDPFEKLVDIKHLSLGKKEESIHKYTTYYKYFGHPMLTDNSLEKSLMLGKEKRASEDEIGSPMQ